jgi:hypothetical protein
LSLKEKTNSHLVLNALIDDDDSSLDIELGTFALNIKKEVLWDR